ncbi:MAG TPA: porin family protein [Bacteroidia bacterium]|nr:PorT family protein [Bacteroidia bacterium]QQR95963.1 MAG: PorT family protein [Bacteroidota bacterium]MBP7715492.1 PorT family protein [Bacteroidia bacterium]MBP8667626.1 PorT family protein [Bacteroidia bacterium]HOZ82004.1 porin family protein [Bacteroidia bacterium]
MKQRVIVFSFLVLLFNADSLFAQKQKILNLPKYDRQRFHFGFILGINKTDFVIDRVASFSLIDSLYTVESKGTSGFNLQIVTNMRMGEHFDLRFLPGLAFASRNLIYTFEKGRPLSNVVTKKVESTFVELPLDVKFKSARLNNFRAYVLGGVKYSIDMVSQAKVKAKDKEYVKLQRNDYGYEIGVGCDFYLPMFKFSPEIKMYHGLRNLLVKDDLVYSKSLDGLFSKMFTLSLTFE